MFFLFVFENYAKICKKKNIKNKKRNQTGLKYEPYVHTQLVYILRYTSPIS